MAIVSQHHWLDLSNIRIIAAALQRTGTVDCSHMPGRVKLCYSIQTCWKPRNSIENLNLLRVPNKYVAEVTAITLNKGPLLGRRERLPTSGPGNGTWTPGCKHVAAARSLWLGLCRHRGTGPDGQPKSQHLPAAAPTRWTPAGLDLVTWKFAELSRDQLATAERGKPSLQACSPYQEAVHQPAMQPQRS